MWASNGSPAVCFLTRWARKQNKMWGPPKAAQSMPTTGQAAWPRTRTPQPPSSIAGRSTWSDADADADAWPGSSLARPSVCRLSCCATRGRAHSHMPLRLRSGRKRASRRVACGCLVDCSSRRSAADTPTRRGSVGLGLSRPRVPSSARGRAGQAACPPGARLAPVPMRVVNTCRSHTGMPLSLSGHALRPADRPGLPLALASPAHPNKCFFFLKKMFLRAKRVRALSSTLLRRREWGARPGKDRYALSGSINEHRAGAGESAQPKHVVVVGGGVPAAVHQGGRPVALCCLPYPVERSIDAAGWHRW